MASSARSNRWRWTLSVAAAALVVTAFASSCTDPVLDDQIAGLGPETGETGPNHRPGQPCVLCHSAYGTATPVFSVAGTVFDSPSNTTGVADVEIRMVGSDNARPTRVITTNAAGNFYITKDEYDPAFPLRVRISKGNTERSMQSHIGREPSCAGCHFDPPDAGPGRVSYAAFQAVGHLYLNSE